MKYVDKALHRFKGTGNFIDCEEEEVCCPSLSEYTASFEKGQAKQTKFNIA